MTDRLAYRDLLHDGLLHACDDQCGNDAIILLNGIPTPVRVTERGPYYSVVEFTTFDDYEGEPIEQALASVLAQVHGG